jgi:hypothetical protein
MIGFPFAFVLIPYGLVVLFFALFAVINVYHLVHYGATTGVSFVVTFLFLAGAVFIMFFTWQALAGVDWGREVNLAIPFLTSAGTPL